MPFFRRYEGGEPRVAGYERTAGTAARRRLCPIFLSAAADAATTRTVATNARRAA